MIDKGLVFIIFKQVLNINKKQINIKREMGKDYYGKIYKKVIYI